MLHDSKETSMAAIKKRPPELVRSGGLFIRFLLIIF